MNNNTLSFLLFEDVESDISVIGNHYLKLEESCQVFLFYNYDEFFETLNKKWGGVEIA